MTTFQDAKPVKGTSTRTAEPNPYANIVQAIALKTDSDGDPVAKAFTETVTDADAAEKFIAKVKRQLSEAGAKSDPKVTVRTHHTVSEDGKNIAITFWTVPRQERPRKDKNASPDPSTQTASTPESVAVSKPAKTAAKK